MAMKHVSGRDDSHHEGLQNNPVVGGRFDSIEVNLDGQMVVDYVNAVGDERFWSFQASEISRNSIEVAPLTIFDREVGSNVVGLSAGYAMQSKQAYRFHKPLSLGESYTLTGEITQCETKRDIGFFATTSQCAPSNEPSDVRYESIYTRAYRFPENQYVGQRERGVARFSDWLYQHGAQSRARFPEIGSVVEGRSSFIDQARINLFSGPVANIHTDGLLARRGGLQSTVAQGLMATELECELYRDLFGVAFYSGGEMSSSYIEPIASGVHLRAACIVQAVDDDRLILRSAVATASGTLVCVGASSLSNWSQRR